MSTTDLLHSAALPEALRRPLRGVSFAHHLVVVASRLDAIATPAVLAWLGVPEVAYGRVEARWEELVSDELARDGSEFDALYTEQIERALCLWGRPVEPLDHDLEAWLNYERHAAESPAAVAARTTLTAGDALRLARRWRGRLADPELARRAARALAAPLAPLAVISAPPLRFPPETPALSAFGGLS
jgi:hypothetical protein